MRIVVLNALKLDVDLLDIHRQQTNQKIQKTNWEAPVGNWGIIWIQVGRNIEKMDIF